METPPNGRREGDERAFVHDPTKRLKLWPIGGSPFRWKASQGQPECVGEYISQFVYGHRMLLYIAVVVTLILIVEVFGPFLMGETTYA